MKNFVGHILNKVFKSTPRSQKVSPTIKSVKPTKDISGSVKRVYRDEYTKRIDSTNKSKGKIDQGKKMMREGQKELRKIFSRVNVLNRTRMSSGGKSGALNSV